MGVRISGIRYALGMGEVNKRVGACSNFLKVMYVQRWLPCIIGFCWCSNDGKIFKKLAKMSGERRRKKSLIFDYFFCFYTSGYAGGRTRIHLIEERKEGIL